MKQSQLSISQVLTLALVIILGVAGLTTCVYWNIGGYIPLVIALCTIGLCLLIAYSIKQEAHVNVPYSSYDKSEYEQELFNTSSYLLTDDEVRIIIESSGLNYDEYITQQEPVECEF